MSKVMSAEEARTLIDVLNGYGQADEDGIICTVSRQAVHEAMEGLRAYADMLDRQTVDREAVAERLYLYACEAGEPDGGPYVPFSDVGTRGYWLAEADAILALMPVSVVARELEWGKVRNHGPIKTSGDKGGSEVTAKGLFNTLYGVASTDGDKSFMAFKNMTVLEGRYESIEAAKAAAQAHYNDAVAKAVKPGPDVSGLVEALEKIAEQNLPEEMDAETLSFAAFDDGYSAVVREARSALSTFKGGEK